MPFAAPASGAGSTSGTITNFLRFPATYEMRWAPRVKTPSGTVVKLGLDALTLHWPAMTQAEFASLQGHYNSAQSQDGLYYVNTWNQASSAYAARRSTVVDPPGFSRIEDNLYKGVSMTFEDLDRPE